MSAENVRVGVGVLIVDPARPHSVFCGVRKGSHGAGCLALPGGHLEMYESWSECAMREVMEETGINLVDVVFGHATNDIMEEEKRHYVTIFMMGRCSNDSDGPKTLEPHKCEGWQSYSWEELREILAENKKSSNNGDGTSSEGSESISGLKLFGPLQHLVEESPQQVMKFLGY